MKICELYNDKNESQKQYIDMILGTRQFLDLSDEFKALLTTIFK